MTEHRRQFVQHELPEARRDASARRIARRVIKYFGWEPTKYVKCNILPNGSLFVRLEAPISGVTSIIFSGPTQRISVPYPSSIHVLRRDSNDPLAAESDKAELIADGMAEQAIKRRLQALRARREQRQVTTTASA